MTLDRILKVLTFVVVIAIIIAIVAGFKVYNSLCNNKTVYDGVEILFSNDFYGVCGSAFSISNQGEGQIEVSKRSINAGEEVTVETYLETTQEVETTQLDAGEALNIDASNEIIYVFNNLQGSNFNHQISVKREK